MAQVDTDIHAKLYDMQRIEANQRHDSRPMMERRAPAARPRDALSGNSIEAGHTPAAMHLPATTYRWQRASQKVHHQATCATVTPLPDASLRMAVHVALKVPQQTTIRPTHHEHSPAHSLAVSGEVEDEQGLGKPRQNVPTGPNEWVEG